MVNKEALIGNNNTLVKCILTIQKVRHYYSVNVWSAQVKDHHNGLT